MEHIIAAKAVAFEEAMKDSFKEYGHQIVRNAKVLSATLMENGIRLVSNGTDNHLMLIDCNPLGITGKKGVNAMVKSDIYTNRNTIPFDPGSAFKPTGIRLGTPALTTRGMKEDEMKIIGKIISDILKNIDDETIIEESKKQVKELADAFPVYGDMSI